MDRLTYKMSNHTKDNLISKGFKYNRYLSDILEETYTYRFPLILYKNSPTIDCAVSVSTISGIVNINVINTSTKDLYPAYYNREYGNSEIIKVIDNKIANKLKRLGIKKI